MVEQLLVSNIMSCHLKPDGRYIAADAENMPEYVKIEILHDKINETFRLLNSTEFQQYMYLPLKPGVRLL